MSRDTRPHSLSDVARAGFRDLTLARESLGSLADEVSLSADQLLDAFALAADPDSALARVRELATVHPECVANLHAVQWRRLALLCGSSPAFASFFVRHPGPLRNLLQGDGSLVGEQEARTALLEAVDADARDTLPIATLTGAAGAAAMRVRYRELLAEVMLYDLSRGVFTHAELAFDDVARSLSFLADAALEAGLAVARGTVLAESAGVPVTREELALVRFSVITMGKCGALELNVVSDVDVMFLAEPADAEGDLDRAQRLGTRLATELMRAIHEPALEPPLWQVDPNLRPEGRNGALVRSLTSMMTYYERWAKTWEFQALLKARAAAGDLDLGAAFVAQTRPLVWASSGRDDFVGSVQRMRERVTEHLDSNDQEYELKLGPGGLRDIEFSVQLLQLVHGLYDESLHAAGTLPALSALVDGGYIARADGDRLATHYRRLRVLEHRLQLRDLRRTALMPRDGEQLRVLARSSRLAPNAEALVELWRKIRSEVHELHLKMFYAPLLSAVAALPDDGFALGSEQAKARLQSIGFRDPAGAMRHLAALTTGTTRTAKIQRNLLPVLLLWLAQGTDPDYGLLAFRRVSEANRDTPWYLRLLRDGTEAAERLTRVLSTSRFAAELLESIPEAVAWLERDERLHPPPLSALREEMRRLVSRRESLALAADALRGVHRREVLRIALGRLVGVLGEADVAAGLSATHTALLESLLMSSVSFEDEHSAVHAIDMSLIALGRFGGEELGFASDLDLLAVYRPRPGADAEAVGSAQRTAESMVSRLRALIDDPRFSVDLDFDLRPEGKNGPLARSLDASRAYYERWSLAWEAQALLRARPAAGDAELGEAFIRLADEIRYPDSLDESGIREIRRIKARVEAERLDRGADPRRHLKLGPGGVSDVEWLVQLLQLRYAAQHPSLRTTSTLQALHAAEQLSLLRSDDRILLEEAWRFASEIRSAIKLWSGRASDVLPTDRAQLAGIAGVLGMSALQTTELEERWFGVSRRARRVFEREFFGYEDEPQFPV